MLKRQDGSCAICGIESGPEVRLVVDHCHETGHVRGLLCRHCNLILGYARESDRTLESAISYLARHSVRLSQRQ
jgi:hypothetical protein